MLFNELIFFNTSSTHIRFATNFALVKITELLEMKGLNAEVAVKRAHAVFGAHAYKASMYLNNIQSLFGLEIMQKVYQYIAHKALLKEEMNFSSSDQLIGLMQQAYAKGLTQDELNSLHKIAKANRYSLSLV